MPLFLDLRMQLAALRALAGELGWPRAVRLGLAGERAPDPFAALPPPETEKDRASRDQIRPALRLYGVLRAELGDEEALRVTETAIVPATLTWLDGVVGRLDVARYEAADEPSRRRWAEELMSPFPNADSETVEAGDARLVQHVMRCRFVELCAAAGVPELAPVFCAGDLVFFERGPIDLTRPMTLAGGGPYCDFRFTLRER